MKTAEDVLLKVFQEKVPELKTMDGFVYTKSIIKAMKEYKNQPTKPSDLKELKDITDEDAGKVGELLSLDYKPVENGKTFIRHVCEERADFGLIFHPLKVLQAFQYLQSRDYRLPAYFPVQRAEEKDYHQPMGGTPCGCEECKKKLSVNEKESVENEQEFAFVVFDQGEGSPPDSCVFKIECPWKVGEENEDEKEQFAEDIKDAFLPFQFDGLKFYYNSDQMKPY